MTFLQKSHKNLQPLEQQSEWNQEKNIEILGQESLESAFRLQSHGWLLE